MSVLRVLLRQKQPRGAPALARGALGGRAAGWPRRAGPRTGRLERQSEGLSCPGATVHCRAYVAQPQQSGGAHYSGALLPTGRLRAAAGRSPTACRGPEGGRATFAAPFTNLHAATANWQTMRFSSGLLHSRHLSCRRRAHSSRRRPPSVASASYTRAAPRPPLKVV